MDTTASFSHEWPQNVPEDLTRPSKSYKKHLVMAMGGLLLFIAIYLALTAWFGFTAYRLFAAGFAGGKGSFFSIFIAIPNAFLAVFMAKALFFSQKSDQPIDIEVTEKDESRLFEFLYALADKAKAPRPHKVFLSNQVNACVFYDLSFLNLLFPSKKNLEIGIGLINVLNLGEFRAVLAHEFGHFAQRSMLLGRWVYISHQIAGHIVAKRDGFDNFLSGLSRIDLRIAWIGWLLSIIVWSIRSIVEMCFRVVVIAYRALSREMEFHADLVAVSLTGSDALIHALHKLQAADQAMEHAFASVNTELADKKAVEDIYALQTNALQQTAKILDDPSYGRSPEIPKEAPEQHRVFKSKIAQPPKMWATHPFDYDREANAKAVYISTAIDDRSSWELFSNPAEIRTKMSLQLIKTAEVETEPISTAEAIKHQNLNFEKAFLSPRYRGIYQHELLCRHVKDPQEIYLDDIEEAALFDAYPEHISNDLEELKNADEELLLLNALKEKVLTAPGGVITHRGNQIKRKDLPNTIETVSQEVERSREKARKHLSIARSAHLKAAEKLGNGWSDYLKGLLRLIHYAEHTEANITDAYGVLNNTLHVVLADGKVTSAEATRVINKSNELFDTIAPVYRNQKMVFLDENVQKKLEVTVWKEMLEEFKLGSADHENINHWLSVIDSWVNASTSALDSLKSAALEVLLETEDFIANAVKSGEKPDETAPLPSSIDTSYPLLLVGDERPIQNKLGPWDRFITADGSLAAAARSMVTLLIIGATVGFGASIGSSKITIYNGLARTVVVNTMGRSIELPAHSHKTIKVHRAGKVGFEAYTKDRTLIEEAEGDLGNVPGEFVYNVAGGSAMLIWTAFYGGMGYDDSRSLGNPKWMESKVDHLFEEPPKSVETKGGSATRDVVTAYSDQNPGTILQLLDEQRGKELVLTRALWDEADDPHILEWLFFAAEMGVIDSVLNFRLKRNPLEVASLRQLQEQAKGAAKKDVCAKQEALYLENPDNPGLFYLHARCTKNSTGSDEEFKIGYQKWPENQWLAWAVGNIFARETDWESCEKAFETALKTGNTFTNILLIDLERVRRLSREDLVYSLNQVTSNNAQLNFYSSLERGNDRDIMSGPYSGYHFLEKGNFELALNESSPSDQTEFILRMAAASDNAPNSVIDRALELNPGQGIDQNTILPTIGLMIREKQEITPFIESMQKLYPDEKDTITQFIQALKTRDRTTAERLMGSTSIYFRGQLCSLGAIVLGQNAPDEWRWYARKLLFLTERPYFK